MIASIEHNNEQYKIDLAKPIDISIPLKPGPDNVNAWWAQPVKIEPVVMGTFVGDVLQGGSVNFRNVFLNPHGNGTHTECVGHISKEPYTLNQCLRQFFHLAQLITVEPVQLENGDRVIQKQQIEQLIANTKANAIVIRTLPNDATKKVRQYSGTNFPYLDVEAAQYLFEKNIDHLLIDLPSVDRESDEGKLAAHHAFWQYPHATRTHATISEMIYVPAEITDGLYFLNLQITALENDASPGKPVLFELM